MKRISGKMIRGLVIFLVLMLLPAAGFAEWTIEAVDAPKNFSNFSQRAIAIDKITNQPHIVYGYDHLYHAYFDGSQWQYETVDYSSWVGKYASIAVDSNNKVHISYCDSSNYSNHKLKYATNATGLWVTSTIDETGYEGNLSSIAIDSNDKAHISYYDYTNRDLKYATNASGSWVRYTIDSTGDVGRDMSIALDSNNKAYISYYDSTNRDLKYATNATGLWVTSHVDSTGDVGSLSSIAIDSNDKAHISYYDYTNRDLKYATNATGSWVTLTIDSIGSVGSYTSIAIDSNNKAHISYYDSTNYDLKYATNATGSWVTSTIDSTGSVGTYTSIAIDSNNKAHICYDSTNEDLKYATNASGLWVIATVDSVGNVGWFTSIAVDSNNKSHISYFDMTNYNLKYATNASGAWVTSTIDSAGEVGWFTSIAVDSNNKIHIGYVDITNGDLKYATNVSGEWITTVVDPQIFSYGGHVSLAIDSANKAHISYCADCHVVQQSYYIGVGILKYATNATGTWISEVVDSNGIPGWYSSIAIDSQDQVYISYFEATNYDLKSATNAPGFWVTTTIDYAGEVGRGTSIAIDSLNNPHISYDDVTNGDLKYAHQLTDSDFDNDGYTFAQGDCNDINPAIYPGAVEICDEIDNNCNGQTDEGLPISTYYLDYDGDGYGHASISVQKCLQPTGYVNNNADCNDSYAAVNPGAVEICDQMDNNCNGQTDEGFPMTTYYRDSDGDGYGNASVSLQRCSPPSGYVLNSADCNDSNSNIKPGAPELCDSIDNNCDSNIDEAFDLDNDGYNSVCGGDCNDNDPSVNPGMTEVLYNDKDDDCNIYTPDDWVSRIIPTSATATKSVIGVASGGNAHIYYCENGQTRHAALNTSGIWETGLTADVCGDMAVDSSGNLHMSYYTAGSGLMYGTNQSGAWASVVVDNTGYQDGPITVDSSGNVHIVYDHGEEIRYAFKGASSWTIQIAVSVEAINDYCGANPPCPLHDIDSVAIAADSSGMAHILYIDETTYPSEGRSLKYLTNKTGSWVSSSVQFFGSSQWGSYSVPSADIAVDSSLNLHIGYYYDYSGDTPPAAPSHVRYSTGAGPNVNIDPIYSCCYGAMSIIADDLNDPHVFLRGLHLSNTSTWTTEGVEQNVKSLEGGKSIAIDSSGYLHVVYLTSSGVLKYATTNPDLNIDSDGDGYVSAAFGGNDCNDNNPLINPDTRWYPDADGDGYGDPSAAYVQCVAPAGPPSYVLNNTDYNDADPDIYGMPVKITSASPSYYSTLQAAYNAAGDGDTIQVQAVTFNEDLAVNLNKTITISGGYNGGYSSQSGETAIQGSLSVTSGSITVESLILQ